MNHILVAATTSEVFNDTSYKLIDKLLEREMLFVMDTQALYIKYNGAFVAIGGSAKENNLVAGTNITLTRTTDNTNLALNDDIIVKTMALQPTGFDTAWKGTVKLATLTSGNTVALFMKSATTYGSIIGGEIFIDYTDSSGTKYRSSYTASLASNGSWYIKGANETSSAARFVKATYNNAVCYGLQLPENTGTANIWFNGWKSISDEGAISGTYTDSDLSNISKLPPESTDQSYSAILDYSTASAATTAIQALSETGEDGAPYYITISQSTLSLTELQALAAICRKPERQIYLDLSACTVDSTAKAWTSKIFSNCVSLRGLLIPQGVTKISECAFIWCTYLRELGLFPSQATLASMGLTSWASSVSMMTSTRVRDLIVPNAITSLGHMCFMNSNLRNLILTHTGDTKLDVAEWTFCSIDSSSNVDYSIPDNFHLFVEKSYYNSGYMAKEIRRAVSGYTPADNQAWKWNNNNGYWSPQIVSSIVLYDPTWTKAKWQTFKNTYGWSQELIDTVLAIFGVSPIVLE